MNTTKTSFSPRWSEHWWLAAIFIVTLFFNLLPWNLEARIRWAGIVFELLGIGVVAWGLSDKSQFFGGRSFPEWVLSFFVKEPLRHNVIQVEGGRFVISGNRVRVSQSGLTVEQQLAHLESRCNGLEDEIELLRKADKELKDEFQQSIGVEREARRSGDEQIANQLKASMVGSLNFDLKGLLFLVLGVFLANGSADFAGIFSELGIK